MATGRQKVEDKCLGRLVDRLAHGGDPVEEVRKERTRGKGSVLKKGKKDFRTNGGVATARM